MMHFYNRYYSVAKIALVFILLAMVLYRPLSTFIERKDVFFSRGYIKNQYESLKKRYYSSQYVQKKNPGIMPDDSFEAFAGGIFLKGLNPILITHDQPPLGRYIIALSIKLFDNANTLTILLFALSGIGIFITAKLILKSTIISLLPVAIYLNEPLMLNKLIYTPLLEPIQLPFIIFSLYFFIKGILSKKYLKWFILTAIMLGFVISTRFFVIGGILAGVMTLYFLLGKKFNKKFAAFILSLPLSLSILILSYTQTIKSGYSVFQIFGIQKYILFYHKSKFVEPLSFWDLLLFNRWHTWWGDRLISSDPQWIIVWPIATILVFLYIGFILFKKLKMQTSEIIVLIWISAYAAMLSTGYTSTRYFLPLLPFIYILALSFTLNLNDYYKIHKLFKKTKKKSF